MIKKITHKLFRFIWRKRFIEGDKLIEITSWNSCVLDTSWGRRERITFTFRKKK